MSDPFDTARAAWPGVSVPRERFLAFVEARGGATAEGVAPDLYLACACAGGDPEAQRLFRDRFVEEIRAAARRVDAPPDEVESRVLEKLLVAKRIEEYGGRGSLTAWVRVIAAREGISMQRKVRREESLDDDSRLAVEVGAGDDPELAHMKDVYRAEFAAAFRDALRSLEPRERTLLRMHHLDGLSIDALADLFKVHRATAARQLVRARESLLTGTLRSLRSRLAVEGEELESILRLVRSRLEVSLQGLLRTLGTQEGRKP